MLNIHQDDVDDNEVIKAKYYKTFALRFILQHQLSPLVKSKYMMSGMRDIEVKADKLCIVIIAVINNISLTTDDDTLQ